MQGGRDRQRLKILLLLQLHQSCQNFIDRSSVGSKSKGVMLAIVVQLKSNIQVFRDDEPVFTGLVEPGERFEWNGDRSVFLISDNAGGLFVELDGVPMTRLGAVGERIEKEWKAVD